MGKGGKALVLLTALLDHVTGNKVLKLLVGAKAEHFLSTACRVALL